MVSVRSFLKRLGPLNIIIFVLAVVIVFHMAAYALTPKPSTGLGSEWWYTVYSAGPVGVEPVIYDERIVVAAIEYCEAVLCYRIVTENPFFTYHNYLVGGSLVRTTIEDKSADITTDIVYKPPVITRPHSFSTGYSVAEDFNAWISVSTQGRDTVKIENSKLEIRVVEHNVIVVSNVAYEAYLIEELANGFLWKKYWFSKEVNEALYFELYGSGPHALTWGRLTSYRINSGIPADVLQISLPLGVKLWHLVVFFAVLLFSKRIVNKSDQYDSGSRCAADK